MNKKWCAIGAGVLTPVLLAGFIGIAIGQCWLMHHFVIFRYAMFGACGIFCLIVLAAIWKVLYEKCKGYWAKKGAS